MEVFPAKMQKLWNALEIRILVLASLFFQMVLIALGNRRKYNRTKLVAGILWASYLSADYVATTALGVLSQAEGDTESSDSRRYAIGCPWVPFLLMHLGGPDTITAYALADNELWLRHALGLLGQVLVAIYIFVRSLSGTPVNFLWWVTFAAGFVKYGERSWVLLSASKDRFRESMVSGPDPGPDYAKFMDEFVSREREGYQVELVDVIDKSNDGSGSLNNRTAANGEEEDMAILQDAYSFFATFKKLFADLILSFEDKAKTIAFFTDSRMSCDRAFSIVEVELGLVCDLFYTKASVLHSKLGIPLRTVTFLLTTAALVIFTIIDKTPYRRTEVIITYFLLAGGIVLEIYAALMLLASDVAMIRLTGNWMINMPAIRGFKKCLVSTIRALVSGLQRAYILPAKMRWCNAMGQYNVLRCCLKGKRSCTTFRQYVDKYLFPKSAGAPKGLKALIFKELKRRSDNNKLGSYRGDKDLLKATKCFGDHDKDYELEFDQTLLIWHLATDLCYHNEVDDKHKPDKTWLSEFIIDETSPSQDIDLDFKREICKLLSNYMMYLLIMSPFMLPSGIGQIRFQDTCAEVIAFFSKNLGKNEACRRLCRVNARLAPAKVKGDRSKSLLFDACRLARSLQSEQVKNRKWEIITQAWLDLLTYAAAQCGWSDHAEKLSQGGELLTHVWLLMAHFGLRDHFKISQGYVRAKLQLA